jgi:ankyrin repeat protein
MQVVEELLNWGASTNITDMGGWTPLHVASFFGRGLICHLLIK